MTSISDVGQTIGRGGFEAEALAFCELRDIFYVSVSWVVYFDLWRDDDENTPVSSWNAGQPPVMISKAQEQANTSESPCSVDFCDNISAAIQYHFMGGLAKPCKATRLS
jgi:hypothetical protein